MGTYACSLHPLDVRLLKIYMGSVLGDGIPDLKEEATRRRQRDLIYNWSQRVICAAAPLAGVVGVEAWQLFTRMRPFFITAEYPEQTIMVIERLFAARGLDDVVNYFREEVARLDPEQADDVIEAARQDLTPPVLDIASIDDVERRMRAYLLYERRQLEPLFTAALSNLSIEELHAAGHWVTWRACTFIANVHPWWALPEVSLTRLARQPQAGLTSMVADPRGAFSTVVQRIPGLYDYLPYFLADGANRTGVCIPPKSLPQAQQIVAAWPDTQTVPTPAETLALSEAMMYAASRQAGLWEVAGLIDPDQHRIAAIQADQGDREEHPERYPEPTIEDESFVPAAVTTPESSDEEPDYRRLAAEPEYEMRLRATSRAEEENPDTKTPWWKFKSGKK